MNSSAATAAPRLLATDRRLLVGLFFLMAIVLYAVPANAMMHPVSDPDIWWHLRTGQWAVEHRAVPQTDPFSAYGQGQPWLAYSGCSRSSFTGSTAGSG